MGSNRFLYWIAQFIGWSTYAVLILLATYSENPKDLDGKTLIAVVNLLIQAIFFTHLMRALSIRLGWLNLKLLQLIPRILMLSLICASFITFGTLLVVHVIGLESKPLDLLLILINVLAISILVLFWNAIYFTYHFFQQSKRQELNNLSLEASKNEIELKNLRSQLNPHFLFNSINSIKALITIEPEKAKQSLTTLSNLLRKSLVMGREDLVPLSTELEMVSNYLELEKIRFEDRLSVYWDIDDRLNELKIPPFCLQMLVENAIKHGVSTIVQGGEIHIHTFKEKGTFNIQVINSGKLSAVTDTGIGIANTRRRLDIQYKGSAKFLLQEEENKVIATLVFRDESV